MLTLRQGWQSFLYHNKVSHEAGDRSRPAVSLDDRFFGTPGEIPAAESVQAFKGCNMVQSSDGDIKKIDLITAGRVAPRSGPCCCRALWRQFVSVKSSGTDTKHTFMVRDTIIDFFSHCNMPGF